MAVTRKGNVVRMTADNDTIQMGKGGFRISGARLVAGSDAATALIKATDTNGEVLISLKADGTNDGTVTAGPVDEMAICFRCDAETLHLDLSGTGAEVFLYLE